MARAQEPAIPLIGFVRSSSLDTVPDLVAAFRQGLKETGYIEGRNVAIDFRSADDHSERLPKIIADLIRRQAAVLVTNAVAAQVARTATQTVPIVFATGGDPVRDDLVASFNRPGRNITGVSFFVDNLGGKHLELARNLIPKPATIGMLVNPDDPASESERLDVQTAANAVRQQVIVVNAHDDHDFDTAFATLARRRAGALVVTGDALFYSQRDKLIAAAARYALPTVYYLRDFVVAGGLVSYGASIADAYHQVGLYTGRILKGEKPGDLPVVQPTKFELVINLRTAKALGLSIPQTILIRADEIIE